ncbi:DnaJ-domain-containing protein, partial [Tilletiopsis washingtonensis]
PAPPAPPAPPAAPAPAPLAAPAPPSERTIALERTSFFQELELDRILAAFRLNPYDILECPLEADAKTVTKIYRKKSLLIHPDKVKDPRAVQAFDLLKKASSVLLDSEQRDTLDEVVISARVMVLQDMKLPADVAAEDERLQDLVPSFEERVRKRTKELMVDDELRRRRSIKMQHESEGEEQRRKEAAALERKRKAEEKETWENGREERVAGWRTFAKSGAKKK